MSALNLVAIVTLLGGAAWMIPALVQQRFRDPMRLHLFMALFLMGLGNVLSQPRILMWLDGVTLPGFTKITYNVAVLTGLCLMVAFLRECPLTGWRAPWPWEVVACAICLTAMTAMTVVLPSPLRNHVLTSRYLVDWRVRTFYNFGNFYLLFGYAACAVLAARHARKGRSLHRLSLSVISVGLAALALSCVFRFLWVNLPTLREPGRRVTYADAFGFGQIATIVVCAGLSLPAFVSVVQMVRERLDHQSQFCGLEELWNRLVEIHPELVLDHRSRRPGFLLANAPAVYRRYVECRDGLTRLSPYLQLVAEEEPAPVADDDPRTSACLVDRALCRFLEQNGRDDGPPTASVFVLAPKLRCGAGGTDYEEDLGALVRLSLELREMRNRRVAEPAATP
ncbi:MAB_1171c family putative transporter [Streptomyces sp. NPDC059761]|uniref:MAB_1171c family putative transporter n=1 Tax=Streptomyces sp. NPDC059761 TaxID=3346937 RepID=UPI003650194C